jgi:protoporphyrinogen oxidase
MSIVYDYLIIGGGISGVAMARLLQQAGVKSMWVLEGASEPGGLCRTKKINGHILDIGGGHFLCTKHQEVYDFVFSHILKSSFNFFSRVSKIILAGMEVDYPLETNLWQMPLKQQVEYLVSLVQNGEARGLPVPHDYEDWIRWKLGDKIADSYMLPYNRKIWGVEPHELDVDWLHKIPRVNVEEILRACLARESDSEKMPSHQGFYYPKEGGYQAVFDAISRPVADILECGVPVSRLEQSGSHWVINEKYHAKRVINTVPWHFLADSPLFPPHIKSRIASLQHNAIVVSLHEEDYQTPAHWAYIPSPEERHHRNFYIRNFAPHSDPKGLYRETNSKRWQSGNGEIYSYCNDYAYPLPTLGWANAIREVLDWARPKGLFGLGRWGQWEYFNSDVCIYQAMQLARQLGHEPRISS